MSGLTPLSRVVHRASYAVMAGLVPAIHDLKRGKEDVDARVKPGHDDRTI
jgi:hypothetical protein